MLASSAQPAPLTGYPKCAGMLGLFGAFSLGAGFFFLRVFFVMAGPAHIRSAHHVPFATDRAKFQVVVMSVMAGRAIYLASA
jgi:hypothetical protein